MSNINMLDDDVLDELEARLYGDAPLDRATRDDAARALYALRFERPTLADHATPCLFPRGCGQCDPLACSSQGSET